MFIRENVSLLDCWCPMEKSGIVQDVLSTPCPRTEDEPYQIPDPLPLTPFVYATSQKSYVFTVSSNDFNLDYLK